MFGSNYNITIFLLGSDKVADRLLSRSYHFFKKISTAPDKALHFVFCTDHVLSHLSPHCLVC